MEKRDRIRVSRHLTCEIVWPEGRASGIVRDITERGLYVLTLANPKPNSVVEVIFAATGSQPEIHLEAGVARKRVAPPHQRASVASGVGLEILPPRTEYERWLASPNCRQLGQSIVKASLHTATAQIEQEMNTYRFRMVRRDQSKSQSLTIHCETEVGARAVARVRAGTDWRIAGVQPL
jgi:hypothetical protein